MLGRFDSGQNDRQHGMNEICSDGSQDKEEIFVLAFFFAWLRLGIWNLTSDGTFVLLAEIAAPL